VFWIGVIALIAGAVALADEPKRTPPRLLGFGEAPDPVAEAANIIPHSEYDSAVLNALVSLLSRDAMRAVCAVELPKLRAVNDAAYVAWTERNAAAIRDIQPHSKALILKSAHNNAALAQKVEGFQLQQTQLYLRQQLSIDGSHSVCTGYARVLKERAGLEAELASQLAIIRSHPLPK